MCEEVEVGGRIFGDRSTTNFSHRFQAIKRHLRPLCRGGLGEGQSLRHFLDYGGPWICGTNSPFTH